MTALYCWPTCVKHSEVTRPYLHRQHLIHCKHAMLVVYLPMGAGRRERYGRRPRSPVTAPKLTKRADVVRITRRTALLSARSSPRNAVAKGADVFIAGVGTCHASVLSLVGCGVDHAAKP